MIYVAMADTNIDLSRLDERYISYLKLQLKSIRKRIDISELTPAWQYIRYIDHNMKEHELRIDYKNIVIWEE